jgi:hypothetical protein
VACILTRFREDNTGVQAILRFSSENWETVMLVLLKGGINEVRR